MCLNLPEPVHPAPCTPCIPCRDVVREGSVYTVEPPRTHVEELYTPCDDVVREGSSPWKDVVREVSVQSNHPEMALLYMVTALVTALS